ncbi:cation:proton antiporter [Vulgatibacter incomptus]|uniref:Na+/H+ antiporter n=1 Tax=Vulgatibacter incomptus TaxID=1391653 RepID=A0A0K1PBA6_9BACT|nr:cation:proton antiporter [Vulgatibacter incomptus]AKU90701.1 Na+/H+ antiporter [Vulgatibacter incomptus]
MQIELNVIIGLLVAATSLAIAAKWINVPYNVALVVGGMLIAVSGILPGVPRFRPEIVFLICLPVLLFEGGITSDIRSIRLNSLQVGLLASLGMLLAVGVSAVAFHFALRLPWGPAVLLATILAGTDTVSVLYAFRRVPAPPRLSGIMEAEALFSDGVTLVFYTTFSAVVLGTEPLSIPRIGVEILFTMFGGASVGLAVGMTGSFVIRRMKDPLAEIMASTAVAYGAYTLGDALHVSGAIAAVTAGLSIGAIMREALTPRSLIGLGSFWEYASFGVNTFLFLSVGLSTSPSSLGGHVIEILIGFAGVTLGRLAAVYIPFFLLRMVRLTLTVPLRWQHVFVAGNIKGALSIALALGLSEGIPYRHVLIDVTFGVTFVSLVGQGFLLPGVVRWLGLAHRDPVAEAIDEEQGRLIAARAAQAELESLRQVGLVPRQAYDVLRSDTQVTIAGAERSLRGIYQRNLAQSATQLLANRRRLIDAERTALVGARRSGIIAEPVAERLLDEVDERLLDISRTLSGEEELEEGQRGETA